jgi:hypothetical protein
MFIMVCMSTIVHDWHMSAGACVIEVGEASLLPHVLQASQPLNPMTSQFVCVSGCKVYSSQEGILCLQEYIVNLWTQDREASQPWSMHTFQEHINKVTGSTASFDRMWARMQKIIGEPFQKRACD